ncbi:HAD family hydrolase [Halorarum halobium]|uniref:HAD family hydrolase n=1 Tax=Halorarum halobium TaxID=3075121 RepID=UPI0028A7677F|nr:HAD family hydrolase [Halobaculum sp. XH14]
MARLAVWFDLDGTLLDIDDYAAILERACDAAGIEPTDEFLSEYDRGFFEAFEAHEPDPYRVGAERAIAAAGGDAEPAYFVDALRIAEFDEAETPASVHDALAELSGTDDVSVGVLTNGVAEWQRGKLGTNGLTEYVDAILTSYDAGAHKPDSAVFRRAEELLEADEHVMVGDDFDADVAASREFGWRGVHVEGPDSVADAVAEFL